MPSKNKAVQKALKDRSECDRATYWDRIQAEIREEKQCDEYEEHENMQGNLRRWRQRMNGSWQEVKNHLEKGGAPTPDVTRNGETLLTKQATCEAIAEHAQEIVRKKKENMRKNGVTVEDQINMVVKELRKSGKTPKIEWNDPDGGEIHKRMKVMERLYCTCEITPPEGEKL